jgi:Rrf2 family protein
MKLSRAVSYALQATLLLAQAEREGPVPCSYLAAEGSMPVRFLLQILRALVTRGILKSSRGVEGGYLLARSPAEISVLEVIEAVDGPLPEGPAIDRGLPEESRTKLECALRDVTAMMRRELRAVTLADLLPADEEIGSPSCVAVGNGEA